MDFLLSCITDNQTCQLLQDVSCETRIFNVVRRPREASLNLPSHAFLKDVWSEMQVFGCFDTIQNLHFCKDIWSEMQILGGQGPPKTSIFQGFRTLQNLHFSMMSYAKCKFWVFAELHQRQSKISSFEGCLKRNASFGCFDTIQNLHFSRMCEAKCKFWVVKGPPTPPFFKDSGPSRTFIFEWCLMRNAHFEFSLSCINDNQKSPVLKDVCSEMQVLASSGPSKTFIFDASLNQNARFWMAQAHLKPSLLKDVSCEMQVLDSPEPSKTFIFKGCLERDARFDRSGALQNLHFWRMPEARCKI